MSAQASLGQHHINTEDHNQVARRVVELYGIEDLYYSHIKEFLDQTNTTPRVHTTCQKSIVSSACFWNIDFIVIDYSPI